MLLFGIALAIAFYPLWQGKFYAVSDMRDVFIPLELFYQQQLRSGALPAWHPDVAWGFPVLASGQIGFFYPPLLLGRLLFPIFIYLPVVIVLHVAASGVGFYQYVRSIGLRSGAAYVGGLTFTFGAFLWQHLYHLNIILALSWFPWQLLAVRKIAETDRITARQIAILSLCFAGPFLVGQFQIPFLMAVVSGLYFLYLKRIRKQTVLKNVRILLMVAVGSALVAAAQIFPTVELYMQSSRAGTGGFDLEQANQHSYPLYHLPTLVFPRFYGSDDTYWGKRLEVEYGFYIGIIPLVLAGVAFISRQNFRFQPYYLHWRFFAWLLPISFSLALGSLSPWRLIGLEPSLWIFSAPARWLLFSSASLSVLAAIGYEILPLVTHRARRVTVWFGVVTLTGVIAANIFLHKQGNEQLIQTAVLRIPALKALTVDPYYTRKLSSMLESARETTVSLRSPYTILGVVIIGALPALVVTRRGHRVLLVLASVELVVHAATATPNITWSEILTQPSSVARLPQAVREKQARIYTVRSGGDTGAFFTNPESRANNELRQLLSVALVPLIDAQFNIPGIEWPASLPLPAQLDTLDRLRGGNDYDVADAALLQEINVGAIVRATEGEPVKIESMAARPRAELVDAAGKSLGAAHYQELSPRHTLVATSANQPTALVVRDTWYPGWLATVDGVPAAIIRSNNLFRQINLAAGNHQVDMVYTPVNLHVGLVISLLATAIYVMVAVRGQEPRRSSLYIHPPE